MNTTDSSRAGSLLGSIASSYRRFLPAAPGGAAARLCVVHHSERCDGRQRARHRHKPPAALPRLLPTTSPRPRRWRRDERAEEAIDWKVERGLVAQGRKGILMREWEEKRV